MSEGERVIVAYGRVHPDMTVTHYKNVPSQNVAVNIDDIEELYAHFNIPVLSDEIVILENAKGSFIKWPKNMVILVDKAISLKGHKNGTKKQNVSGNATNESVACLRKPFHPADPLPPQMGQKCKSKKQKRSANATNESVACLRKDFDLSSQLSQKGKNMKLMLDGYEIKDTFLFTADKRMFCLSEDGSILIAKEDVTQLLSGSWISTSVIELFIVALGSQYNQIFDSIGFMCPTSISSISLESQQRKDESFRYMEHVLKENKSKYFILCPSFEENHWILFSALYGKA